MLRFDSLDVMEKCFFGSIILLLTLAACLIVLGSCGENGCPVSGEVVDKYAGMTSQPVIIGKMTTMISKPYWQLTIRNDGELAEIKVNKKVYDETEVGNIYLFLSPNSVERKESK